MMHRNSKLLGVWICLTLLAVFLHKPWQGSLHTQTSSAIRPLFPALGPNGHRISSVKISDADGAVTLERGFQGQSDYLWKVRERFGHPVDIPRMQHLINSMVSLETRDIVSVNAESHHTYQVEEGFSTRVTILDDRGVVMADLLGGGLRQQDPTTGNKAILSFYVRRAGEDAVYLTDRYAAPSSSPVYWCDTWFLREIEPSSVMTIERLGKDGDQSWKVVRSAEVEKEGGGWEMVAPLSTSIPDFSGNSWVYSLCNLRAADVISNQPKGIQSSDESLFGEVSDVLRAGIGDDVFELRLGQLAGSNRRFAQVLGLPFLYIIAQHEVDQFRQSIDSMIKVERE